MSWQAYVCECVIFVKQVKNVPNWICFLLMDLVWFQTLQLNSWMFPGFCRFRLHQKRFLWFSIYSAWGLWSIMNVLDGSDSPRLSDWRWTPLLELPLLVRAERHPRSSVHTHYFYFSFIGKRQKRASLNRSHVFFFKARRCRGFILFYFARMATVLWSTKHSPGCIYLG